MKTNIISISGEKLKEIELPKMFSEKIREDIIQKVFESEKQIQAYAPALEAGRQQSASGRIRHIRHKWGTAYGKGISRIPRKTMWRRGTQFYWIGAEISSTRGGRRAHPPRISQFLNDRKINSKEYDLAFRSAISSTVSSELVSRRYLRVNDVKIKLPIIVESKLSGLKTKGLVQSAEKILGDLYEIAKKSKKVRSGKGKLRGRKYKSSAGLLIIVGNDENIKTKSFDIKKVSDLSITDLYPLGRIVIYTENAIKDLEKLENNESKVKVEMKQ